MLAKIGVYLAFLVAVAVIYGATFYLFFASMARVQPRGRTSALSVLLLNLAAAIFIVVPFVMIGLLTWRFPVRIAVLFLAGAVAFGWAIFLVKCLSIGLKRVLIEQESRAAMQFFFPEGRRISVVLNGLFTLVSVGGFLYFSYLFFKHELFSEEAARSMLRFYVYALPIQTAVFSILPLVVLLSPNTPARSRDMQLLDTVGQVFSVVFQAFMAAYALHGITLDGTTSLLGIEISIPIALLAAASLLILLIAVVPYAIGAVRGGRKMTRLIETKARLSQDVVDVIEALYWQPQPERLQRTLDRARIIGHRVYDAEPAIETVITHDKQMREAGHTGVPISELPPQLRIIASAVRTFMDSDPRWQAYIRAHEVTSELAYIQRILADASLGDVVHKQVMDHFLLINVDRLRRIESEKAREMSNRPLVFAALTLASGALVSKALYAIVELVGKQALDSILPK